MKLGAQLYSVRDMCQNPTDYREAFRKIKEIGYEVVQISGGCAIEAEKLRAYSDEFDLPITSTHRGFAEFVNSTDDLIKYHKILGCKTIGIGGMPVEYRGSLEATREFIKVMKTPIAKIRDAGFHFSYHNHAFEFDDISGTNAFNVLIDEAPEMDFILDVGWSTFAGADTLSYIKRIGVGKRMIDVHFKDFTCKQGETENAGSAICHCGGGIVDFLPIYKLCVEIGVENAQVEQDNAPDLGDSFGEMKKSYDYLSAFFRG